MSKLQVSQRKSEIQDGGFEIQLHKSQLIHMIATKFLRLHLYLCKQATRRDYRNTVLCLGMLKIKDGGD